MSSMDVPTLEFFVEDSFFSPPVTAAQLAAIVALLEPERESIEYAMSGDYDPEAHSWRAYRSGMWHGLEQYDAQIRMIVGESGMDESARQPRTKTEDDAHVAAVHAQAAPEPVKHWIDGYEEHMRKHIQFALDYAANYGHGAPGHLDLMTIATLARQLSFALDEDVPYRT